jgi:uncharacterized protein YcbX
MSLANAVNLAMLSVSQLYIYPVKSLGGIAVTSAIVTNRGLQYDRRYMLVDGNNLFLTQRELPAMALIRTAIEANELLVCHKNNLAEKFRLPLVPEPPGLTAMVKVWDDWCEGQYINEGVDKWFSDKLNFPCRLVYMPESTRRKVDAAHAFNDDITSFSDGYPILLIGQSSLDDLNSRLEEALPVNRFRPNIVVAGGQPFEEDTMEQFSINEINFYGVKLCERCVITTTNQETGIKGKEPLKTLAKYRMTNNKVLFGQNVLCQGKGVIRVGDEIKVVKTKPALIR